MTAVRQLPAGRELFDEKTPIADTRQCRFTANRPGATCSRHKQKVTERDRASSPPVYLREFHRDTPPRRYRAR